MHEGTYDVFLNLIMTSIKRGLWKELYISGCVLVKTACRPRRKGALHWRKLMTWEIKSSLGTSCLLQHKTSDANWQKSMSSAVEKDILPGLNVMIVGSYLTFFRIRFNALWNLNNIPVSPHYF